MKKSKIFLAILLLTLFLSGCSPLFRTRIVNYKLRRYGTENETYTETRSATEEEKQPEVVKFPELPEELRENITLRAKNEGSCREFTGNVEFTFIFLNDSESVWSTTAIQKYIRTIPAGISLLKSEANAYGSDFLAEYKYYKYSIAESASMENSSDWYKEAIETATGRTEDYFTNLEDGLETPVIFVINREARSYAMPRSNDRLEYAVVFNGDTDLRHEVLHLFGATDLYIHDTIIAATEKYFPNSVMYVNDDDSVTDELNAYLIGWVDEPGEKALAFLRETASITYDDWKVASEEDRFTGYVENHRFEDATYTGDFYEGSPHGKGKIVWDTGESYDGDWVHGKRDGVGTYVWKDASYYVGDWKENSMTGFGTYYWSNGDKYEGEWKNGDMDGEGVYTYASGRVSKGIWEKGKLKRKIYD